MAADGTGADDAVAETATDRGGGEEGRRDAEPGAADGSGGVGGSETGEAGQAPGTAGEAATDPDAGAYGRVPVFHPGRSHGTRWLPGQDVRHAEHGPGWVQGSGVGRVTVRFEVPGSPPGRIRTFPVDDPDLTPSSHLPLAPPGDPDP